MYVTALKMRVNQAHHVCQWPISAGHEFTVTTDPKYNENSDDRYMFVDYVSEITSGLIDMKLTVRRSTYPRLLPPAS